MRSMWVYKYVRILRAWGIEVDGQSYYTVCENDTRRTVGEIIPLSELNSMFYGTPPPRASRKIRTNTTGRVLRYASPEKRLGFRAGTYMFRAIDGCILHGQSLQDIGRFMKELGRR